VLAVGALLAGIVFKDTSSAITTRRCSGARALTVRRKTTSSPSSTMCRLGVWSPFVAMVLGFAVSWLFYIRSPDLPGKLAEQHQGSTSSCSTSGISTSCTT
jgi:NADH-quinone oxidoreductase subunit L